MASSSSDEEDAASLYRSFDFDQPSQYLTASQRRRMSRPQIYRPNSPRTPRSSVLRAIFTPQNPKIDDLAQDHSFVYVMLHPKSQAWQSEVFKKFISSVIVGDLLAFVLSTDEDILSNNLICFRILEGFTSTIFLLEYIARVAVCIENSEFSKYGPLLGRLRWMCTYPAILDVLATSPYFLQVATGWAVPKLSYFRIFRLLRILKTDSYTRAFSAVHRVIYFNREILSVAALICFFLVTISSVLLYYLRPRDGMDELEFDSIPATLYLSVLILTGQDSFIRSSQDMPWYTKLVVGITGTLSVAMYAIPVSLLTWGFEAEAERCARKTRKEIKRAKSKSDDTVNSSESDEEYLKIIAKGSSESGENTESYRIERLTKLTNAYIKNDFDGRRYFQLAEFLANSVAGGTAIQAENNQPSEICKNVVTDLQYRIGHLEASLASINEKLETICDSLQGSRSDSNLVISV